jgi:hypothetical protein
MKLKDFKVVDAEILKQKKRVGRPNIYNEKTRSLSMQVPLSAYDRLKTILDYELEKLKIKK